MYMIPQDMMGVSEYSQKEPFGTFSPQISAFAWFQVLGPGES